MMTLIIKKKTKVIIIMSLCCFVLIKTLNVQHFLKLDRGSPFCLRYKIVCLDVSYQNYFPEGCWNNKFVVHVLVRSVMVSISFYRRGGQRWDRGNHIGRLRWLFPVRSSARSTRYIVVSNAYDAKKAPILNLPQPHITGLGRVRP